jgi:head-tail adaptor
MEAGVLADFVTIQTRAEVSDGHDGVTETWTTWRARGFAQVRQLVGRDLDRARQIDPRASWEVRLRYWRTYVADLRGGRVRLVYHDGPTDRTLEVVGPPQEIERHESIALTCREAA